MRQTTLSYIRDEIFNILKMCHYSVGVVPCADAQTSHGHTLKAPVKMEMHRISIIRYIHVCTPDVTDERLHMYDIVTI